MHTIKIHFYKGATLLKKIAFQQGNHLVVTIGKVGQQVDVELESNLISRQHGQLIFTSQAELFYVDLGSTNGSFYKTKRIPPNEQIKLQIGDKLSLTEDHQLYIEVVHPDAKAKVGVQSSAASGNLEQTDLIDKFRSKNIITIGRASDCDVQLDSSSISRRHCQIERQADGTFFIKDLGSLNGTFVNGRKIRGGSTIKETDLIIIGRFSLSLRGEARNLGDETAIRMSSIEKQYPNGYVGLHETSLSVPSKSLLAIMGPSGCGKSTLLKALNGEAPPSRGNVYLFEQELVSNYEYLKTQIGYVPQDDIVHRQLTVEQSLYYAAKLRLENPPDFEIEEKIEEVLKDLNILNIRHEMVSTISGGQRKRVSIAVELLTDPLILFLDEPTSPLDPQTIEEFLGILRTLADKGTTIVMVTHKPEDLEYMDQVIFMAEGGHLVYYGAAKDYQKYFSVQSPVKVYMAISGAQKQNWIEKFKREHPTSNEMGNTSQDIRQSSYANSFLQWRWLTARYLSIKTNDKANTGILIAQSPIIAALLCLIFKEISLAVPFLMAISAIWFGVNNAAREIVSELPIYKRERMFNTKLLPYIMSKLTVLTLFSAIQSLLFVGIVYLAYSGDDIKLDAPVGAFCWMLFLSMSATMMGLLLSAVVSSAEKVMTLVPIALIPQILLGGFIAKIKGPFVELISYVTLSKWGTEGFTTMQDRVIAPVPIATDGYSANSAKLVDKQVPGVETLHNNYYHEYTDWFGDKAGDIALDFVAVSIWSTLFFLATLWALKKKDSIPRTKEK